MKIYISGKITGLNLDVARANFQAAEDLLKKFNLDPVNPMKLHNCDTLTWGQYMGKDIEHLLKCEGIYMMSNWRKSIGARVEYAIAKEFDLKIFI